jgi:hypothetical protein
VGISFRRSKTFGPFHLTLSKRGLGASVESAPLRIGRSATGWRTMSFRIFPSLFWRKR